MVKLREHRRQVCARDTKDEEPEPPGARPFNPWRIPKTERARAVVEDVLNQIQNHERYYGARQRRRKAPDQKVFEATLSAIICDLMHYHLTGRDGGVFITRSKQILGRKSRYYPLAYGTTLPDTLDRLATPQMAFMVQHIGIKNPFFVPRRTIISPGPRLISRIKAQSITFDDLGRSHDQEVIVLKGAKEDYWDEGELNEYEDTREVEHYRAQMHILNGWIAEADISLDEFFLKKGKGVDCNERRLRRVFTRGRFDRGGRLFGGFWQVLSKRERGEGVDIEHERAVELDYGQMNPRILYGLCGVPPPPGDLYLLPGFEAHRSGIKKVMNAMMFATKRLTRMPKGIRLEFLKSHGVDHVIAAIEGANAPIKDQFFMGIGHHIQFLESQILVDLLLTLRDRGIVALPLHDGVMVPTTKKDDVRHLMLSIFHRHTGVDGLVREEVIG